MPKICDRCEQLLNGEAHNFAISRYIETRIIVLGFGKQENTEFCLCDKCYTDLQLWFTEPTGRRKL